MTTEMITGVIMSRQEQYRDEHGPGREGLDPGRERSLPQSFRQFLENQNLGDPKGM